MTTTEIRDYFDGVSPDRDELLDGHEIIRYEQARRQHLVMRLLAPRAGERLLDVGCGNGRDLRAFAALGARPVGIDFSFPMLLDARRQHVRHGFARPELVQGEGIALPFQSGIFDKIVCSEVVEHVPAAAQLIRELHRVLAPGGTLALTTPNRVSLYGLYRRVEETWGAIKKAWRRRGSGRSGEGAGVLPAEGHPYDQWKTNLEVKQLLADAGFESTRRLHSCYIPSHASYKLSRPLQRALVRIASRFEQRFESRLSAFGYTIGFAARKVADTPPERLIVP